MAKTVNLSPLNSGGTVHGAWQTAGATVALMAAAAALGGVYESKLGAAAAAAAAAAATSAFAVAYATTPPSDRGASKQLHRQLQLRDHRALELVALLEGIVGGAHAVDEVARAAPAQSTEPNVLSRRAPPLPRCLTCPSVSIKTCHAYGVMMCQIAPPHNQKKTHCEHSDVVNSTRLTNVVLSSTAEEITAELYRRKRRKKKRKTK